MNKKRETNITNIFRETTGSLSLSSCVGNVRSTKLFHESVDFCTKRNKQKHKTNESNNFVNFTIKFKRQQSHLFDLTKESQRKRENCFFFPLFLNCQEA